MKKYTARFERYDFTNGTKKIIFKNVMANDELQTEEAYMDALKVPYLIGNLVMGERINFIAYIENNQITNPMRVEF